MAPARLVRREGIELFGRTQMVRVGLSALRFAGKSLRDRHDRFKIRSGSIELNGTSQAGAARGNRTLASSLEG